MMTKSEIIKKANEFCAQHNIHEYPINIVNICEECGIKVFEESLPQNVSGFIISRNDELDDHPSDKLFEKYNSDHVIVVNRSDSAKRRRFTIAHELAHFVLHRNSEEDLYAHRDAGQNGGVETEANIFASNILMPENLVREAIGHLEDFWNEHLFEGVELNFYDKVEYISNEFAVSIPAAMTRLEQLKIS